MSAKEDYLRIIYHLEEDEREGVKSVDIARTLNISKPSVSEMLRKLEKEKLVKIKPYSKVLLTARGREIAEKLFDKHFTIKNFMKRILQYDDEKAREEAHKLEHASSEEAVEILEKIIEGLPLESESHKKIKDIRKPMPSYIG